MGELIFSNVSSQDDEDAYKRDAVLECLLAFAIEAEAMCAGPRRSAPLLPHRRRLPLQPHAPPPPQPATHSRAALRCSPRSSPSSAPSPATRRARPHHTRNACQTRGKPTKPCKTLSPPSADPDPAPAPLAPQEGAVYVWRYFHMYRRDVFDWSAFSRALVAGHQQFSDAVAAAQPPGAYAGAASAPGLVSINMRMRDDEVDALVAYLQLLQRLIERGPALDTPAWVRELEGHIMAAQPQAASPGLLELLFRFSTLPVPSKLKAALFEAVSAFATDATSAGYIWAFIKDADVVAGLRRFAQQQDDGYGNAPYAAFAAASAAVAGGAGAAGALGPKFDLAYQLMENESSLQSYEETTAFVSLVNALLELSIPVGSGPAAAGGLECLPVFHFVRDTVYLLLHRSALFLPPFFPALCPPAGCFRLVPRVSRVRANETNPRTPAHAAGASTSGRRTSGASPPSALRTSPSSSPSRPPAPAPAARPTAAGSSGRSPWARGPPGRRF